MIPKVIHQVWVGDKRIPKHIKEWMQEIKDAHTEYEYYFWHDGNLNKLPERLQFIYDSLDQPAMKCDLLRVYLCYTYGGIYLDVDYKLITKLDNLYIYQDIEAAFLYNDSESIHDINNSFIASVKGSYLLKHLLSCITHEKQWLGPHWFGESILKYLDLNIGTNDKELVSACDRIGIKALNWDTINRDVIRHDFLASWYPNSEWNLKLQTDDYE